MSDLAPLQIIPAGAGSGKTHTIQHQLGEWVASGKVAPERIVAVTYTEAAAAELRERIGARLLELGRIEDALRLSQAYISTIHGFGLRILTEFALRAGTSPHPRLLSSDEENALLRQSLALTDKANDIIADLGGYGYNFHYSGNMGPEDMFRARLLEVTQILRSINLRTAAEARALVAESKKLLAEKYGKTGKSASMARNLQTHVKALLHAFPTGLAQSHGVSRAAREDFIRDHSNLAASANGTRLETDWSVWQELRTLRTKARGTSLPEYYVELAAEVTDAADNLIRHPGPLSDAQGHLEALLMAGQEALVHYQDAKRNAGLVDYTDMIAAAERLLRERPDILESLTSRIDCLVVDEFQDTNPLQFALLWRLHQAGVPTLVVGDLKQAIMGFQGADPRLFEALQENHPDESNPLTRNWRSQPKLMRIANALGTVLFKQSYVPLAPQREDGLLGPLEIVRFKKSARTRQHQVRAEAVGLRLRELLANGSRIVDRYSRRERPLRGSDIAVLCPTHTMLAQYADVLECFGLRYSYQSDGWLASRAVQIAWHALAYLANPADRHAALYLAVTELGSLSLEEGLRQLMDDARIEDPLLKKLDALAEGVADRTVYALVADALNALDMFNIVQHWPDGGQARANLLRLLGEAGAFMDASREALAHGGYYGSGVQTFLAWLTAKCEEDDSQPPERVIDEDAITLRTWHSAKGLEWPVVAVCGLDRAISAQLPNLELTYRSFDDLQNVLENVRVDFSPKYAAPEQNEGEESRLHSQRVVETRRLLYVAVTRAREKLILEWPEFVAHLQKRSNGDPRPRHAWAILGDRCKVDLERDTFVIDQHEFACKIIEGGKELQYDDYAEDSDERPLPRTGRRAIRASEVSSELTPDIVGASELTGVVGDKQSLELRVERYGEGLDPSVGLSGRFLGSYLHRCFEVLGPRPDLSGRLKELTGVDAPVEEAAKIATAVAQFEALLKKRFAAQSVQREWPVLAMNGNGSVLAGLVDLIVRTAEGAWILDHKSDRVEDVNAVFRTYLPQLQAYKQALTAAGETVLGVGIHWIRRGELTWRPTGSERD